MPMPKATLPPLVAKASRNAQRAYVHWLGDPRITQAALARKVEVSPATVKKWKREQNWDEGKTAKYTNLIGNRENLELEMQTRAHDLRTRHLRTLPQAYQLALLKLEELAELDEDGNVIRLREVTVGHTARGEAIRGFAPMKDIQSLVNAMAKHWDHTSKLTGIDHREKKDLAASRDQSTSPVVTVNVNSLSAPAGERLISGSVVSDVESPDNAGDLPDL